MNLRPDWHVYTIWTTESKQPEGGKKKTNQSFRDQRNNSKIANSNIIGISEGEK